MKFGHDLPRNQVPEWASSYINYKGLKRLIKTAAEALQHGLEPDLAGKGSRTISAACGFLHTTDDRTSRDQMLGLRVETGTYSTQNGAILT